MSVDALTVLYIRDPDLRFYYSEIRNDHSKLKGVAPKSYYNDSAYAVKSSKDPAIIALNSEMQRRVDEYHMKRKELHNVFIQNNPYIAPCEKWGYSCGTTANSSEDCCVKCCCFLTVLCCFPVITVMCCPYNCCFRGGTNEKQWLEATMVANPDLDGAVLDAALVRSLEEYRDQLNQQSTTRIYDFSFQKNYRYECIDSDGDRNVKYVDQILFTVMNRPYRCLSRISFDVFYYYCVDFVFPHIPSYFPSFPPWFCDSTCVFAFILSFTVLKNTHCVLILFFDFVILT